MEILPSTLPHETRLWVFLPDAPPVRCTLSSPTSTSTRYPKRPNTSVHAATIVIAPTTLIQDICEYGDLALRPRKSSKSSKHSMAPWMAKGMTSITAARAMTSRQRITSRFSSGEERLAVFQWPWKMRKARTGVGWGSRWRCKAVVVGMVCSIAKALQESKAPCFRSERDAWMPCKRVFPLSRAKKRGGQDRRVDVAVARGGGGSAVLVCAWPRAGCKRRYANRDTESVKLAIPCCEALQV